MPVQDDSYNQTLNGIRLLSKKIVNDLERMRFSTVNSDSRRNVVFLQERFKEINKILINPELYPTPENLLKIDGSLRKIVEYTDSTTAAMLNENITNIIKENLDVLERILKIKEELKPDEMLKELMDRVSSFLSVSQSTFDDRIEIFRKAQMTMESTFQTTLANLQTDADRAFNRVNDELFTAAAKHKENADILLEDLNGILDKAREMQQEMSGRTLSDFFSKRAQTEKWDEKRWTIATWGFALLTLAVVIAGLVYQITVLSQSKDLDLSLIGTKVLLTITLGLIAKWCSKRANRHLAEEAKYHRLAINVLTIDAFASKLDEAGRNEMLKTAGIKMFTEIGANDTATDFETVSVVDLIKNALPSGSK